MLRFVYPPGCQVFEWRFPNQFFEAQRKRGARHSRSHGPTPLGQPRMSTCQRSEPIIYIELKPGAGKLSGQVLLPNKTPRLGRVAKERIPLRLEEHPYGDSRHSPL